MVNFHVHQTISSFTVLFQPCSADAKDVRTAQCESFNGKKYKNQTYSWKPLLSKCKLPQTYWAITH